MRINKKERVKIARRKLKDTHGASLMELLLVVGIILILSGVGFISVWSYQRSLAQLERDGIAKEIFVAAQNHLTAAKGEGYLGIINYGIKDSVSKDEDDELLEGVYFSVANGDTDENSIVNLMLPYGSIDETVRIGGSYIIRYQPETATVMDVFYCSKNGSPERFNHTLSDKEYATLIELTGEENKSKRRTYTDDSVLGWYGHTEAVELTEFKIKSPKITIVNAEKLYVTVEDVNSASDNTDLTPKQKEKLSLSLIIEGASSGAKKAIPLLSNGAVSSTMPVGRIELTAIGSNTYKVILDDITTSGLHFADLGADPNTGTFIPGENLKIKAVAFSNSELTNIAYSGEQVANSLFGSISDGDEIPDRIFETAAINNIRHLENLDPNVSGIGNTDLNTTVGLEKFKISKAVQSSDMSWLTFQKKITGSDSGNVSILSIYYKDSTSATTPTGIGAYYPVSPNYALDYNGQNYSITDIVVNYAGPAGLFGDPTGSLSVRNLQLVDFSITSTGINGGHAGALAGTLDSGSDSVTNVIAYNTKTASTGIKASDCAGGLIGIIGNGSVTASAAALIVKGEESAGGLIGTVSGVPTITACFSGGHTSGGMYEDGAEKFNVRATGTKGTAGGLVGVAGGASIEYSYSTCSVSGATCGGFVGSAGKTISNCYCTGLVGGDTADNAFIGSGSPTTISGNHYYEIINEVVTTDTNGNVTAVGYKDSGSSSGVTPFDASAETYNSFVGDDSSWKTANAYDAELRKYYAGKYCLKTVAQLGASSPAGYSWSGTSSDPNVTLPIPFVAAHYGDWPAPEIFVINESSN